jgi:hypothetical protein
MALLTGREASLRVSRNAAIQLVLEAGKDAYIWPLLKPCREASLRSNRKAAIQTELGAI